jgi:putative DNA primase/helicase
MEINIATGRNWKSRETKTWHNNKVSWRQLVEKLSETVRTPETYKEYSEASKERQSEIKDRGGFVGGYLNDGKRSPENVTFRQLLTLDLDYANLQFWDDFTTFFDVAAVIHSTHKHSLKTPRYRLIIPLNRKVSREEYEAISRKLAGSLDINLFDPTTFQPERLMYWPTTSKDGIYFFEEQAGPVLNADHVLNSYEDWQDISAWPKPDSEGDLVKDLRGKQGNPEEKPGLIGAFCRAYDIHQAIEKFLPDVYEQTAQEDRYTYARGSGASGAIVYDDQFLFSHHSTDPIHGQLVNSFDLIRLHLYGVEDQDGKESDITKKKSYKLMNDFASSLPEVVKEIGAKKLSFDVWDGEDNNNDWVGELTWSVKTEKYHNTIPNFQLILANDPLLKGRFKYDLFNQREVIVKPVPWSAEEGEFFFTDDEISGLRHYLEKEYQMFNVSKVKDALSMVFQANTFHPVRDYINSLVWDGISRVDTLLIDYLGAEDTNLTRTATRKALVACVARVFQPGIKFDFMLSMLGPQGIGKSRLLSKLGGKWYSDSFLGVEGTKAYEQLHGVWIMEVAELAGFKRSDVEAIKHFISKQVDSFRVAYGEKKSDFPRQVVFFGTSNLDRPYADKTGNRRHWPIDVKGETELDISEMPTDQIWAEAFLYYRKGERLYFDALTEEEAFEEQSRHTEEDDRAGLVAEYLEAKLPVNWPKMTIYERRSFLSDKDNIVAIGETRRVSVCVAEIWTELFKADYKEMGPHNTKYIHQIMNSMPGWEKANSNLTFPLYGKQRAYVRSKAVTHFNRRKAVRK